MSAINIDGWFGGCKTRIIDWIDGKSIYINCQYYNPGANISNPARDESFLLPLLNLKVIKECTDSVINALMFTETGKLYRMKN